MSFYVERIIIKNRVPFEGIDLSFRDKSILVLTAFNGKGKTTILSYIVDAWVEMSKGTYSNSYEGRENNYYRVSSPLYDMDRTQPSIVYIRFSDGEKKIDYLGERNGGTMEWYESTIPMPDKIPYASFMSSIEKGKAIKKVSSSFQDEETVKKGGTRWKYWSPRLSTKPRMVLMALMAQRRSN